MIPQDAFLFEGTVRSVEWTVPRAQLTARENIDPFGDHSDVALNSSLGLIHSDPAATAALRTKLRLDAQVAHEGCNYSAGERQLRKPRSVLTKVLTRLIWATVNLRLTTVALVRAMVKGSKVLLLDEATSSVDPETDALIQRIIQQRFRDITVCHSECHLPHTADRQLISIAHRLQTVAYYDRVLVLDAGCVVEVGYHHTGPITASIVRGARGAWLMSV